MRLLAAVFVVSVSSQALAQSEEDCSKDFETLVVTQYERENATRFIEHGPQANERDLGQMEFNFRGAGIESVTNDEHGLSAAIGSTTIVVGPRYSQGKLEFSCYTSREIGGIRRDAYVALLVPTPVPDMRERIRACPATLEKRFEEFERNSKVCPNRRRALDREWTYRNLTALSRMSEAVQGTPLTAKESAVISAVFNGKGEDSGRYTSSDVVNEKSGAQVRLFVINGKWTGANNPFGALIPPITDKKPRVIVGSISAERDSGKKDIGVLVLDSAPLEEGPLNEALKRTVIEGRARLHESALLCERASRGELCKDECNQ